MDKENAQFMKELQEERSLMLEKLFYYKLEIEYFEQLIKDLMIQIKRNAEDMRNTPH